MKDPRLTAYAMGELSAEERAEVEALLARSPEAREELEHIRRIADVLTRALAAEAGAPVDPAIESTIHASLAGGDTAGDPEPAPDEPSNVRRPMFLRPPWPLAAAAVLVIMALGVWTLPPDRAARRELAMAPRPERPSATSSEAPSPSDDAPPESVRADATGAPDDLTSTRRSRDSEETRPTPPPAPKTEQATPLTLAAAADLWSAGSSATAPALEKPDDNSPAESPRSEPGEDGQPSQYAGVEPRTSLARQPATASRGGRLGTGSPEPQVPPAAGSAGMDPAFPGSYGLATQRAAAPANERRGTPAREDAPSSHRTTVDSIGPGRSPQRLPGLQLPRPEARGRDGAVQNPNYVDVGINPFRPALSEPLSTFGLDVDTGSYANVRRFLRSNMLPPAAAVRVEEMVNYFDYDYPAPRGDEVFGVTAEVAACPWEPRHRLVRIAIKARELTGPRPAGNFVFLVDVSGSMEPPERLPLLKQALAAMVKRLSASDRVAIVTYASRAGVHLESTSCERKERILAAIDALEAGGSTYGEGGIRHAYDLASRYRIEGGINRVILCTDGDFNVGISNQDELVRLIREKRRSGIFLTALGVGTDNFKDALMRRLADEGNGVYRYLDSFEEARRVLVEQMNSTLVTVARDAKAQVEFNPGRVHAWRLVGYEKRLMDHADFHDDTKDAGEIGAGQAVTVLYEIVPPGVPTPSEAGPLKYQRPAEPAPAREIVQSDDLLTLKLRYQRPEGSRSALMEIPVADAARSFREASGDFRFAAAVAAFAMALRESSEAPASRLDLALELARGAVGNDPDGTRAEFISLVEKARDLVEGRSPGALPLDDHEGGGIE